MEGIVSNRILAYQIVTMIQKRETCLYCGQKMESKTAKKKFCSPLHRVYYNRELRQNKPSGIRDINLKKPLPEQFSKIQIPEADIEDDLAKKATSPEIPDWKKQLELRRQQKNK